jgi:hypothetical protein
MRQVTRKEELTTEELQAAQRSYEGKKKGIWRRKDRTGLQLEMRLTFDQWLSIWLESGKILMRGVWKGQYCMARKGDLGHYEVGNVFIQLASENARDAKLGRPGLKGRVSPTKGMKQTEESNLKRSAAKLAQPRKPCPHCSKDFEPAAYGRFHGERCKDLQAKR